MVRVAIVDDDKTITDHVEQVVSNMNVFAGGSPISFTVKKGKGTKQTTAVAKADNERNSYITLQPMIYSTKAPCILGLRVRTSGGSAVTDYKTYRTAVKRDKRPHLPTSTAKKGTKCVLRGQVDSVSGATAITVSGLWAPSVIKVRVCPV